MSTPTDNSNTPKIQQESDSGLTSLLNAAKEVDSSDAIVDHTPGLAGVGQNNNVQQ